MWRSAAITNLRRWLAVVLAVAAIASFAGAWWITHRDHEQRAAVAAPTQPSPSGAAPRSSIARSTVATGQPILRPIVPQHLIVAAIGVNTTVTPAPSTTAYDEFLGRDVETFGAPPVSDMYTTTWWSANTKGIAAPRPGSPGMAVILGHTQIGGYGVFNRLSELRPRQRATVSSAAASLTFEVITVRSGIPKSDARALNRVLVSHPAAARLALITCSGHFNGRESAENTVVFLRLIAAT